MSNFEKGFNSGKMRRLRWPIVFAVLVLIGFIAYHHPVAGGITAGVIIVGALVAKIVKTGKL